MKAIILTAGSGRRMRPLTDETHKTLLRIGGRTVIQWILDALLENGVSDIVVVTGYRADALRAHIAQAYPSLAVTYVHNERFAQTNNIYSMSLALERISIDSDILLIECDLIFEPSALKRLLASPHANVALVDHYRSGMDGTVVSVSDGVITDVITPARQGAGFCFEDKYKTLNIYRFSRDFCAGTFRKLLAYYASAVSDNVYYELVLGIVIYLQHAVVHAEQLGDEKWAELDDPNDVQLARFQFDPPVQASVLAESFGGLWNYDVLDFCFLRNAHFPTGAILSELRNALPDVIHNYGSSQEILNRKMAYVLLCREDRLFALNGASQVYPWLQNFFAGRKALIPRPTFGEYARIFPEADCYFDEVGVQADEIVRLAKGCDPVALVNPNNPTGSVLSVDWIYEFAEAHGDKTIVVDESFIDFTGQPGLLPLLEAKPLPNVILIKSLSKSLGIPGLRLGCLYTAHPGFSDYVRSVMPIWNLNSMAEYFLELILKHRPDIEDSFRQTMADRETFAGDLKRLPVVRAVYPGGGNFVLVELAISRDEALALADRLLRLHRIFVKDVSHRFRGTSAYWRLAVRLPGENAQLVEGMKT